MGKMVNNNPEEFHVVKVSTVKKAKVEHKIAKYWIKLVIPKYKKGRVYKLPLLTI